MNKKKYLLSFAFILIIAVLAGTYILFNEIFPKAGRIFLPERQDIISVSVGINNDEAFEINDVDLAELLRLLGNAKPTREQSLNDNPGFRPYYRIEFRTSEIEYRYFIYKDNSGQIYIEIPYKGIYRTDDEIFSFVLKRFED